VLWQLSRPKGLYWWHHLLRSELRPGIYFCVLAYYHHDAGLLYVSTFVSADKASVDKLAFEASTQAQLMTVPPYAVAAIILLCFSFASDKLQTRGIFMAASSSLGGVGYLWG
jgi:hypothetical protein